MEKFDIESSVYLFIDDNVDDVRRITSVSRYWYGAAMDGPRTQRSDRFAWFRFEAHITSDSTTDDVRCEDWKQICLRQTVNRIKTYAEPGAVAADNANDKTINTLQSNGRKNIRKKTKESKRMVLDTVLAWGFTWGPGQNSFVYFAYHFFRQRT